MSNRIVSVCCPMAEAANARLVETSVKVIFGDAARLRFSSIRQQTILCMTRVEAAISPPYWGCAKKKMGLHEPPEGRRLRYCHPPVQMPERESRKGSQLKSSLSIKPADWWINYRTERERKRYLTQELVNAFLVREFRRTYCLGRLFSAARFPNEL